MKRRMPILILVLVAITGGVYYAMTRRAPDIVLTGIVTTDDVVVSAEIQGRLSRLLVKEGDTVTRAELLAVIQPQEYRADLSFYTHSAQSSAAAVRQAEADLKYQEAQTRDQIRQAESNLAATEAQVAEAQADLENAQLNFRRTEGLYGQQIVSSQAYDQARTAFDAAKAHVVALEKQVQAQRAAVALAQSNAQQVAAREAMLAANQQQLAAAAAQRQKADVRLGYTEIHAPIDGIVDVRAALQGEVVNPAQPIVTLINPDNLWVRIDVPETYIDRIRLGQQFPVRLPSGAERPGTVFFRGVDAGFATQRDVSRTKRDIKTFEVRLRCDNRDRVLAVGMTAYVTLPISGK